MNSPKIGIIMGSASDLPVVQKGLGILDELKISYEVAIASAHRTPAEAENYARNARKRGLKVIIAVAGMSAALPGVVAAMTTLPVIGVPVKGGAIDGLDALLSVVQMPPGVPVASMGLNACKNASILAVRILAINDNQLTDKLNKWMETEEERVVKSRTKLKGLPSAPVDAYKK